MEQATVLNVRGKARKVFYSQNFTFDKNGNLQYPARIREPNTGSSIRGKLVETSQGWRFKPTNKESMSSL